MLNVDAVSLPSVAVNVIDVSPRSAEVGVPVNASEMGSNDNQEGKAEVV